MQYVHLDETPVLVTTVEPPRAGDRIFTLQKEFPGYKAGTVFVRKQGQTVQADPGDIRALEDRFATAAAEFASRTRLFRDLRETGLIERIVTLASDPRPGQHVVGKEGLAMRGAEQSRAAADRRGSPDAELPVRGR